MIYGKLPVTFLSAVSSEKRGSLNSEIARFILSHLAQVQSMGIQEMAQACHVSPASLSRFCKEIGLSGFQELKDLLAENKLEFQRQGDIHASASSVVDCIRRTERSLDMGKLNQLCQDLCQYEKVAAFGLLKAGAACLHLQGDLLMLGKPLYTNVAYAQQLEYIQQAGSDALILIFSYTGSYFDKTRIRFAGPKPPRIWMVSGQKRSYPKFVHQVLGFDSLHDQAGHPYQLMFAASLISQEYARMLANHA